MFRHYLAAAAALVALLALGRVVLADDGPERAAALAETGIRGTAVVLQDATAGATKANRKPAWVRRGNALCRQEKAELETLPRPTSVEQFVPYLREAIAIGRRYERKFRTIPVPRASRAEMARLNRLSANGWAILDRMLAAAERGDSTGVLDAADDAIALARRANPTIRKLGFDECAMSTSGLAA
jgi:hypothetical protein